jgi:FtsP/CotA-like multicopper oxidase with cupredoxin domain
MSTFSLRREFALCGWAGEFARRLRIFAVIARLVHRFRGPSSSRKSLLWLVFGFWLLPSILVIQLAVAADPVQPPICSAATVAAGTAPPPDVCTVTPLGNGNAVEIYLTAQTGPIEVGGYTVDDTDHYNNSYLTPIVEAHPGDTVKAKVVNALKPRPHDGMPPSGHDWNPTNLHYFHGGIVSPANTWPLPAEQGTGDNVYVYSRSDKDPNVKSNAFKSNAFELTVPIPLDLDARVLEDETAGTIPHPLGLNWYHSHLHGISSTQVMGGMSGLLSAGDATANVKAACKPDPAAPSQCSKDPADIKKAADDTDDLKKKTKVYYALLRDISLTAISKRPDEPGTGTATWDPMAVNFPPGSACKAWDGSKLSDNPELRLGFCQSDNDNARLFTLNGQRYPTIRVKKSENLLVRIGNLSANIGYDLELKPTGGAPALKLTVLSVDGVVPAWPVTPDQSNTPVAAIAYPDLLLMPASRAEFYIRNDQKREEQHYILRTKGVQNIGKDEWPEIQLAEIILEKNDITSEVQVALNALVATPPSFFVKMKRFGSMLAEYVTPSFLAAEENHSPGCMRDLNPALNEYRRVTFDTEPKGSTADWNIQTEIIQPTGPPKAEMDQPADANANIGPFPFDVYDKGDGTVNWDAPKHVCIKIDHTSVNGGHKQLWVISNATGTLHNFHIHQMKFRLATRKELMEKYNIDPGQEPEGSCGPATLYKCFDDKDTSVGDPKTAPIAWHDTIPVPPVSRVFIIMSFDATQQIGRFVYHCHILKHEDRGLMAPIEVWGKQ